MTDERPNIVLVTVDSLRADHCGFHGYEKDTTPTLDSMAEDGLVFENAIAPGPKTPESMPAIFTGQHPLRTQEDGKRGNTNNQDRIKEHMKRRQTLAARLRNLGYTTIAFTPNPFTSRHYGFDEGFEYFEDFLNSGVRDRVFRLVRQLPVPFARALVDWLFRERSFKSWETFYEEIQTTVQNIDEPYLLWVLLMDTHTPYFAPRRHRVDNSWYQMMHSTLNLRTSDFEKALPETVHNNLVSAYDDATRYTDQFFERLSADLTDSDPVFVVHSDHGEGFFEHESYYHRRYLYRENVHVPLLISNTDLRGTIETPVSLKWLPEIIESLARDNSESLKERFQNSNGSGVTTRSREGNRIAYRSENSKIIAGPERIEYFDHDSDPKEQHPTDDDHTRESCLAALGKRLRHEDEVFRVSDAARQVNGGWKT